MSLTMVQCEPDLSLIRLPMQTPPQLSQTSYPPSEHIPGKTPFTPTGLHMYNGDKKSGSRIAAMLHESPMYGQLVAASAYNNFA